jgi:hypothetical protein
MMIRTLIVTLFLCVLGVAPADRPPLTGIQTTLLAQQSEPVDEFVPIDQLPPQDQLPAAPLLVVAYSFAVLVLLGYVVSVARRLGGVQRDLDRLQAQVKQDGRG